MATHDPEHLRELLEQVDAVLAEWTRFVQRGCAFEAACDMAAAIGVLDARRRRIGGPVGLDALSQESAPQGLRINLTRPGAAVVGRYVEVPTRYGVRIGPKGARDPIVAPVQSVRRIGGQVVALVAVDDGELTVPADELRAVVPAREPGGPTRALRVGDLIAPENFALGTFGGKRIRLACCACATVRRVKAVRGELLEVELECGDCGMSVTLAPGDVVRVRLAAPACDALAEPRR